MARTSGYRKIASGGHIQAKRMIGCEYCNFMELANKGKAQFKTGDNCPRCASPTLRLYDSKAEFKRAQELKILRDNDKISDLEFQPKYPLHVVGPDKNEIHIYDFVPDFQYYDIEKEDTIVEDVKGQSGGKAIVTDVAKMKISHFEAQYGKKVLITKR